MSLLLKALAGALLVALIQLCARTKLFYLSALIPLFPTFTLIAHYSVGSERSQADLKETALFGAFGMIPYLIYLGFLYFSAGKLKLPWALSLASGAWIISAIALIADWQRWRA